MKRIKNIVTIILAVIIILNISSMVRYFFPLKHCSYILKYSKEYKLDPYIVSGIIKTESNFRQDALSHKDAYGLMQITPETAQWVAEKMGMSNFNNTMLDDPELNVKMGCWYLNNLREEFGDNMDLILAAYNGGRGNVQKWLKDSDHSKDGKNLHNIPFKETNKYVKKVKYNASIYKFLYENKLKLT